MKTYGGFLMSQIERLGGRAFNRILKDIGIDAFNGAQGRILYVLWEYGRMTITEVGKLTSLAKTTLTSMLDRMEDAGLILRIPDPDNRRQIFIETTPEAMELRDAYERVSEECNDIFYDGFTEDEILFFEDTLRRIIVNFEKREEG